MVETGDTNFPVDGGAGVQIPGGDASYFFVFVRGGQKSESLSKITAKHDESRRAAGGVLNAACSNAQKMSNG